MHEPDFSVSTRPPKKEFIESGMKMLLGGRSFTHLILSFISGLGLI